MTMLYRLRTGRDENLREVVQPPATPVVVETPHWDLVPAGGSAVPVVDRISTERSLHLSGAFVEK